MVVAFSLSNQSIAQHLLSRPCRSMPAIASLAASSKRSLEALQKPGRLDGQARDDGPRPFDVGTLPICTPWLRAVGDGEQVAGLVGEFDDRGAFALVRGAAICLSLRSCLRRILW